MIEYVTLRSNLFWIINVVIFRWRFPDFGITGGLDGGPMALYNNQSDALFISPFSQFMVASPYHAPLNYWYGWGIAGSVKSYPADFKYETIIYYSPNGIRDVSFYGIFFITYTLLSIKPH